MKLYTGAGLTDFQGMSGCIRFAFQVSNYKNAKCLEFQRFHEGRSINRMLGLSPFPVSIKRSGHKATYRRAMLRPKSAMDFTTLGNEHAHRKGQKLTNFFSSSQSQALSLRGQTEVCRLETELRHSEGRTSD